MTIKDQLTHYGVLGMKWGVRRFQPYGKGQKGKFIRKKEKSDEVRELEGKVANTKAKAKLAKQAYVNGPLFNDGTAKKKMKLAKMESRYAKEDLANRKILEKVNGKEKSKYQLKMEAKYKAKGMTDDEAAVAAYQNIKTKKILAAGATVALGYAAYKVYDDRVDKILKSDKLLQNISANSTQGIRDSFYSSGNKLDNIKYRGLYAGHIQKNVSSDGAAYQKTIKVLSDLKQASPKNAQKALEELYKNDKDFAKNLAAYMEKDANGLGPTYMMKAIAAKNGLAKGVVNKQAYEVFNAAIVDRQNPNMQELAGKYFKTMTEKGYNAIKDVNDSKYSGYKSINPMIIFDAKDKIDIVNVTKLSTEEVGRAGKIATASIYVPAVGGLVAKDRIQKKAAKEIKKTLDNKKIKNYIAEHPNTKLSNTDIIRMLEREKVK